MKCYAKEVKRTLLTLLALGLIGQAGASDKLGLYTFGVQYEHDLSPQASVRFAGGVPATIFITRASGQGLELGFEGAVSYLRKGVLNGGGKSQGYYGATLSGEYDFGSAGQSLTRVNLHGLLGIHSFVNQRWSLFGELAAGPTWMSPAPLDWPVWPGWGFRLGVNYTLP